MTDPNVTTTPEGEEVVLEPGDPGYVEPLADTPPTDPDAVPPEGGEGAAAPVEVPPGEDLTFQREPGESDAEFMARTRNVAVVSQSPSDIVPNTPQSTMGVQVPVEGSEGKLVTSVPAEVIIAAEAEEEAPAEEPPAEEAPPEEPAA